MNHAKGFDSLFIVFVTALSGFQSGLLSRQFHVTPMVQDTENECRVFETREVTLAEKQGKGTRNKICLRSTKTFGADGETKTPRCGGPMGSCKSLSVHVRCRFAFRRTLYLMGLVTTLCFSKCGSVRAHN